MDSIDKIEVKFDPHEQKIRYIETRLIEQSLLSLVESVYKTSLKKDSIEKTSGLKFYKGTLRRNLEEKYNSWQSFYNDKLGLNSGGIGEAITRMVGAGILENFPDIYKVPLGEDSGYGVNILSEPKKQSDKCLLEVVVKVDRTSEDTYAKFRFNTSIKEIKKRDSQLDKEIEAAEDNFNKEE